MIVFCSNKYQKGLAEKICNIQNKVSKYIVEKDLLYKQKIEK